MYTIKNGVWQASINGHGAELWSLKNTETGLEYLWQGDGTWKMGHPPVLFPIVGRQKDDTCTYGDAVTYNMPSQGFAKKYDWEVLPSASNELHLMLSANDETKALYPFDFELHSQFILSDDALTVRRTVKNIGLKALPFTLGEHFPYRVPLWPDEKLSDYAVEFEVAETAPRWPLTADHYQGEPEAFLVDQKELALNEHTFDRSAHIFHDLRSSRVTIAYHGSDPQNRPHGIEIEHQGYPCIAFWAEKGGAPYLCIEPWMGHDSAADDGYDFFSKEYVCVLESGEEKSLTTIMRPQK